MRSEDGGSCAAYRRLLGELDKRKVLALARLLVPGHWRDVSFVVEQSGKGLLTPEPGDGTELAEVALQFGLVETALGSVFHFS
jgi:hypothetical protein